MAISDERSAINDEEAPAADYQLLVVDDSAVVPVPPPATALVVVEVVSPANLPADYQFTAETADGQTVTVTVPAGGVAQGDVIAVNVPTARVTDAVPVVEADDEEEDRQALLGTNPDIIPTGAWRDGLCGCCNHGCCHPHLCMTIFGFAPILLAQVMYRMRLNWYGSGPTESEFQRKLAFYAITLLFWSLFILPTIWATWASQGKVCLPNEEDNCLGLNSVMGGVSIVIGIYFFLLVCRTRRAIRYRFHIPETSCCCCLGCEDFCCTYWCGGLTVMQMARHTAEYETYSASYCSKTGVAARHPPVIV